MVEAILHHVLERLGELAPQGTAGDERPVPSADLVAFETLVLGRIPRCLDPRSDVDWRLSNAVAALLPFLGEPQVQMALDVLHRDFAHQTSLGSRVVAAQLGGPNEDLGAQATLMVRQFLDEVAEQLPVEGET